MGDWERVEHRSDGERKRKERRQSDHDLNRDSDVEIDWTTNEMNTTVVSLFQFTVHARKENKQRKQSREESNPKGGQDSFWHGLRWVSNLLCLLYLNFVWVFYVWFSVFWSQGVFPWFTFLIHLISFSGLINRFWTQLFGCLAGIAFSLLFAIDS